jgi:hypothetical protein
VEAFNRRVPALKNTMSEMDASHPKVGSLELGLTNEKNYELHPAEKSIGTAAKEF